MTKEKNGFSLDNKKFVCPSCGMTSINTDYCYKCDYLVTDEGIDEALEDDEEKD
jgi:hypothetical protein